MWVAVASGGVRAGPASFILYFRRAPDFCNLTGHKPTSYYEYLTTKGPTGESGLDELYHGNLWKKGMDAMKDVAKYARTMKVWSPGVRKLTKWGVLSVTVQ